jgi:hypothetical protein
MPDSYHPTVNVAFGTLSSTEYLIVTARGAIAVAEMPRGPCSTAQSDLHTTSTTGTHTPRRYDSYHSTPHSPAHHLKRPASGFPRARRGLPWRSKFELGNGMPILYTLVCILLLDWARRQRGGRGTGSGRVVLVG